MELVEKGEIIYGYGTAVWMWVHFLVFGGEWM
jgi:hypothetical protein